MTRHPQISTQRLQAWAGRRAIPVRRDRDWLFFTDEALQACALRVGVLDDRSVVAIATLPLIDEGHDLGLARASAEDGIRVSGLRSMADGAVRHNFVAARYAKDPTKLDLIGVVFLGQGVTDTQLDQVIPDLVDAVGVSGAFHPLIRSASQGEESIHEGGAAPALTWKWRKAIADQPVAQAETSVSSVDTGDGQVAWWNADPKSDTPPVAAERILDHVQWLNADALLERRNESDVVLLRSLDLTFEVTIFSDGRMNISHRRELSPEEMEHSGLKDAISDPTRSYPRLTVGVMPHPDGGTMRVQYTHHLSHMSDEQIDATIQTTFTLVRRFIDSLEAAFSAPGPGKDGK